MHLPLPMLGCPATECDAGRRMRASGRALQRGGSRSAGRALLCGQPASDHRCGVDASRPRPRQPTPAAAGDAAAGLARCARASAHTGPDLGSRPCDRLAGRAGSCDGAPFARARLPGEFYGLLARLSGQPAPRAVVPLPIARLWAALSAAWSTWVTGKAPQARRTRHRPHAPGVAGAGVAGVGCCPGSQSRRAPAHLSGVPAALRR